MYKRMIVGVVLLMFVVALAGCTLALEERRANLDPQTVLPQKELVIRTENGYVNIEKATGSDIVVEGVKVVRGDNPLVMEAYLNTLGITITESTGKVEIAIKRSVYPTGVASASVNLSIQIPIDVVNNITVTTTNGRVTVKDASGVVNLQTSNGDISLDSVTGDMNLYVRNGMITGEGIAGQISAETSNGSIRIETERKLDNATLVTENAGIYFDGALQLYGAYTLETSNGTIEMYLPEESQFSLEARTSNGQILCDFPVIPEPTEQNPVSIEGEVNGGGPLVDLFTSNGDIIIAEQWF